MARVKVYWNVRRGTYSVTVGGALVGHSDAINLAGVTFQVSEPGRQRVLTRGKKNVHAYVVGEEIARPRGAARDGAEVLYNPRLHPAAERGSFVRRRDHSRVTTATVARLRVRNGRPFILAFGEE